MSGRVWVTQNVKVCPMLQKTVCLRLKYTKIKLNRQIEYAEVWFYFLSFTSDNLNEAPLSYAMVSVYSRPVQSLLVESSNTLWACRYCGDEDLRVVDLSRIISCVSMQPLPPVPTDSGEWLWFVIEKSGLDDIQLTGCEEPLDYGHSSGDTNASLN